MNRADRRTIQRAGLELRHVEAIVIEETKERFNIAFELVTDAVYRAMRNNRVGEDRAKAIMEEMSKIIISEGSEVAKQVLKERENESKS